MKIERELSIQLLYKMMLIRAFETVVGEYKLKRQIYGMAHSYNGQEAVAVGICAALERDDYVMSNHRPHGHAIAKGVDVSRMMAEIFGKSTGTNGGKGGSMHISDSTVGFLPATGIVGSGIPVACGAAFASKYKGEKRIACVFLGDGAANEGVLHECLNYASIWKLPLLFVLEDNGLAVTTCTRDTSACEDYTRLARAYGIGAVSIDGQDVEMVYETAIKAADDIRNRNLPMFIQAKTIRFNEHAEGEYYLKIRETNYRDNDILAEQIENNCPIRRYTNVLLERKVITKEEVLELERKVNSEISDSLAFAVNSPAPDKDAAFKNIY